MKESEGHTCKGVQVGETGWSAVAGNGRLRQTVCMGVIDICCLQYLSVTAFTSCISIKSQGVYKIVNLIETCFVFYRYFEEHFASTLHSWDGGGWGCVCFLLAGFRHPFH